MAEVLNNIEELVDKNEKLIDIWGRRNPKFEIKYEKTVMRAISDYGVGASENTSARGKVFGSGYEPYIMAFFIGLYAGKKLHYQKKQRSWDRTWSFGVLLKHEKAQSLSCVAFLYIYGSCGKDRRRLDSLG